MLNIQDISPEDAIDPNWLPEYKKQEEAIFWQIVQLNTQCFILQKISQFPFEPLYAPHRVTFWTTVYFSLYESSLMTIWRIAVDTGSDFLTLKSLKNGIYKNIRNDGHYPAQDIKDALSSAIRNVDFENKLSQIENSVRDLRHSYVAHLKRERATGSEPRTSDPFPFNKLKEMKEVIIQHFEILTFNRTFLYLPLQYAENVRESEPLHRIPDIEKLLDQLADQSSILHEPEDNPHVWIHRRKRLSPETLSQINNYRERLGLGSV